MFNLQYCLRLQVQTILAQTQVKEGTLAIALLVALRPLLSLLALAVRSSSGMHWGTVHGQTYIRYFLQCPNSS
jgi:hypothetical protein